jgi:hypothetical protein
MHQLPDLARLVQLARVAKSKVVRFGTAANSLIELDERRQRIEQ